MNLQKRKRLSDLEHELIVAMGKGLGEGIVRDFGKVMHTVLYLKWVTHNDLLSSTGNSAQYYLAAWREGGVWGRRDTCIHVWLSSFAVHLKLSQHC